MEIFLSHPCCTLFKLEESEIPLTIEGMLLAGELVSLGIIPYQEQKRCKYGDAVPS